MGNTDILKSLLPFLLVDKRVVSATNDAFYATHKRARKPLMDEKQLEEYEEEVDPYDGFKDLWEEYLQIYSEKAKQLAKQQGEDEPCDKVEQECQPQDEQPAKCCPDQKFACIKLGEITDLGGKRPEFIQVVLLRTPSKVIDKLPTDPESRCNTYLKQCVQNAHNLGKDDVSTLMIFVAPETYFRSRLEDGRRLHYTKNQFKETVKILSNLGEEFPDILIVPGSIMWKRDSEEPRTGYDNYNLPNLPEGKLEKTYNTSVILYNKQQFFYYKNEIGGDEGPGQKLVRHDEQHGVFEAAGLVFGMRICADSDQLPEKYPRAYPEGPGVDVDILIAEGQGIGTPSARSDGYGIRVDSLSKEPSEACDFVQVQRSEGIFSASEIVAQNPFVDANSIDVEIDGVKCTLIVYDPVKVPPPDWQKM